MARVAINGFGRIGRAAFKIALDTPGLEVAAINDLVPPENLAYLLKYDTVYGRHEKSVRLEADSLVVDGKRCRMLSEKEKDPARLPWADMDIDLVFECTGRFTRMEDLQRHIEAGARHVILSAPAKSPGIETIVYGVNKPAQGAKMISCASCTTNCIAPVVEVMGRRVGIRKAVMTAIHAYTSTQALVDGPSGAFRRGRAGAANLVPTSTGAAIATTKALPQYEGKFDGVAVRAPVAVGSISDIVMVTERKTSKQEVNDIFRQEARSDRYSEVLGFSEEPIVSADIIKDPRASVVDMEMTQVVDGDLVKVMSWYDNEWGYSSQMIREAVSLLRELKPVGA